MALGLRFFRKKIGNGKLPMKKSRKFGEDGVEVLLLSILSIFRWPIFQELVLLGLGSCISRDQTKR